MESNDIPLAEVIDVEVLPGFYLDSDPCSFWDALNLIIYDCFNVNAFTTQSG